MVGIEASTLAMGAGRTLASLAGTAAKKLAGKVSFRWRVGRRVRKSIEFTVDWRAYRKWLKTITSDELATPGEKIQALLTQRLDDALMTASKTWASSDDHLSRSLQLVELTYPAIAAALDTSDREELRERWTQHRFSEALAHLSQLPGARARLSSKDLGAVLLQQSKARRSVRLQAFELEENALASYFDRIKAPQVSAGQVVTLIGGYGSGKSETAEAWHRAAINTLTVDETAPYPVWLSARDLLGQSLESTIDRQLGTAWRLGRGASIAIDGVDETEPKTADHLLKSARHITAAYANIRVLLTTRPGIMSPTKEEELPMRPLGPDEALELVGLVSGTSTATWNWTAELKDTVTRPFFALAAGTKLGGFNAPRGKADLIRNLVEDALKPGAERSVVTSRDTWDVLKRLAVENTRTGRDNLPFSERQIARSSRLVADGTDGKVGFTLPIFQQWFAAQSILDGDVLAEEVIDDRHSFNRWRWAATIALISAPATQAVDSLAQTWVTGNPGAAAWILKETFGGRQDRRSESDEELDPTISRHRIITVLKTWMDALGPLGAMVLPTPHVQNPDSAELQVRVSDHRVTFTLSEIDPDADESPNARPMGIPLVGSPSEHVLWQASYTAPKGEAWPWILVQQMIAKQTLTLLSTNPSLGAPDGVWAHERRFDLARRLLDQYPHSQESLPARVVKERALEAFTEINQDPDRPFAFSPGSKTKYWGIELDNLITWIEECGCDVVAPRLPAGDTEPPISGWISHAYSPERFREFVAEAYANACDAYDEALTYSFKRLSWSMSDSALAPFGVIIEMSSGTNDLLGGITGISVIQVPMAMMPQHDLSTNGAVWSASGRAVVTLQDDNVEDPWERIDRVHSWLSARNREPIAGISSVGKHADEVLESRPASSIAASWLWRDLKAIGLGEGTFPRLR